MITIFKGWVRHVLTPWLVVISFLLNICFILDKVLG